MARCKFDIVAESVDCLGRSLQDLVGLFGHGATLAFLSDLQGALAVISTCINRQSTVEQRIRDLRGTGMMGILKIARQLGVGVSVVQRVVA